nr:hypothetical protein [Tanacetum cinerariifolium]
MTTLNVTSSTDSQMHNNIMAAGSRDHPPMLATGRYPQWRSRFLRYIDTRPNGEALRKCILSGLYKPTTVLVQAVEATNDSPAVPEHTTVETPMNMSPENKAHFLAEKEAIHLILTGIGDEFYSTVDAFQTAQEMWEAIERLQQGESLNIQDVKTNLFWEFIKFTSHNGETMESYYTRFYKLMNEMIRNNLTITMMQVNVQFLQQLQPEWSRFVTIVKQKHKLDEVSHHKLFDILKQYQNEVNKLRAEIIARNANPLALVATAQANQDPYYKTSRSHKSHAPSSKPSIPTRSHTATRHKGKEIAKPITSPSETASEEDNDPEQAQRDKDITSSNSRNKNVDTTPWYKNDDHSGQFGNQRTVHVAGAREKVGSPDSAYHKEKMLWCKQAEQGVPLQAEQYDWLADTDEEVDEQELEAHYSYMDKIQEVPTAEIGTNSELVEHVQNDAGYNMFANDLQHSEQSESVSNTCLVETDDSNVIPDSPDMCEDDSVAFKTRYSFLVALQTKQAEFKKYKAFNDRTIDYDKLEHLRAQLQDKNITISELKKLIEKGKGKYVDTKFDRPSVVRQPNAQRIPNPLVLEGLLKPVTAQTLPQTARQAMSNTNMLKPGLYRFDNKTAHTRAPQLSQTVRNTNPRIVQLILFIVDSGCTKHMTGNLKLLCNFVEKFLGLNHNLFSVGQFCDSDLEVAFRKSTCFVRDLQGNDLLTGNRGSNLYIIFLQESTSSTPLCLMDKATLTQAWLWHRRLSYLNFEYINLLLKKDIVIGLPKLKYVKDQLCSSCELSKAKRSLFKSKAISSLKGRLNLLHMDLCGPMRVATINGKKYILVIVNDYSRYTWTLFLRSKDETPQVLKEFLTMIQRNRQAPVITVRTDKGTEFLNKTLNAFFKEEGIEHQTSTARARTLKQNGARRVDGLIKCKLTSHVYRVKAQVVPSLIRKRNKTINTHLSMWRKGGEFSNPKMKRYSSS